MTDNLYNDVALAKLQRSYEILEEAVLLLHMDKYKGANNRFFYSCEKALQALLIKKGITATTHIGILHQFNMFFIHNGDGSFNRDDYKFFSELELIRSNSDYDDFYIASKQETMEVCEGTVSFIEKCKNYLVENEVIDSKSINSLTGPDKKDAPQI